MSEAFWTSLNRDLPPESRALFERLRSVEEIVPPKLLASEVKSYLALVEATAEDSPRVAVDRARELADSLFGLLKTLRRNGPREHHLAVQAACRYFTSEYDGEDDMESLDGFDDDVEVMNAVAEATGQDALKIDLW